MLIKEYRIPLPLSVEEYRIAQLYMIAKKSRQESSGSGSGVEIFVNEPYEDGPGGRGQFTHKIYHVGSHLPGWLKSLVPKSALTVEEEAWNAYPYTKTRYTCPFVERFSLEIETKYFDDAGDKDNVFELSGSEIRNRQVDLIDVVRDQLPIADYVESEDPIKYVSEKSQRGPLDENWIDEHRGKTIMCAYKLCKVEFRYWGMQTKIERFIHDVALRKTMLRAHRQAWAWQDEWLGLTMEDVRRIEAETQAELAQKMAAAKRDGLESEAEGDSQGQGAQADVDLKSIDADSSEPVELQSVRSAKEGHHKASNIHKPLSVCPSLEGKRGLRSGSRHTLHSPGDESWRMAGIERDSDSESEEFFDAEDFEDATQDIQHSPLAKWSSVEMVQNSGEGGSGAEESIFAPSHVRRTQERVQHSHLETTTTSGHSSPAASPGHQMAPLCPTSVLILVLHGGNVLDHGLEQGQPKSTDVATFAGLLEAVIRHHYPALQSRIATRLVACPAVCAEALAVLSNLSPFGFQGSPSFEGISYSQDPLPIAALPLFAVSTPEYAEYLGSAIATVNTAYHDFLKTPEGLGFGGQVVLVGDSLGAILAFDAASRSSSPMTGSGSHFGSETSLQESKSNPLISISNEAVVGDPSTGNGGPAGEERRSVTPAAIPANASTITGDADGQGAGFFDATSFQKLLCAQTAGQRRRSNSGSSESRLDFEPTDLFMFGSPVALILSYRKMVSGDDKAMPIAKPANTQVYNLFHPTDPLGLRIEPLISAKFAQIPPVTVPRFQKYPLGDGQPIHLLEFMQSHAHLFADTTPPAAAGSGSQHSQSSTPAPPPGTPQPPPVTTGTGGAGATAAFGAEIPANNNGTNNSSGGGGSGCCSKAPTPTPPGPTSSGRRTSEASISSTMSGLSDAVVPLSTIQTLSSRWWGNKRIDYALYCPEGLANFPAQSLPHLFHASYWESSDVASFVIRQLVRCDSVQRCLDSDVPAPSFVAGQPREKWLKKRTSVKIKNVTANHRANDVIVKEGAPQLLSARFVYGPLDMVNLSGEKVDIHVMRDTRTGDWTLLGTEQTDKSGRVNFVISTDKTLPCGLHPVKMVVRGDHTTVDFFLTVVPPKTETVVFSIDGSFTASVSVSGRDPKVRAGAVDVVRHWQELGYLIIYITGRPDMQQRRVVAWLVQHNFPHGLVSFVEGLSTGPLQHKTDYLRKLQNEAEIVYHAAYGSAKDISVYSALGIAPEKIFIAGKVAKKLQSQATPLVEGYAQHLADLRAPGSAISARPAQGNARMLLSSSARGPGGACFGLHGLLPKKRRSAKRTSSYPLPPRSPNAAGPGSGSMGGNVVPAYATPSHKHTGNNSSSSSNNNNNPP